MISCVPQEVSKPQELQTENSGWMRSKSFAKLNSIAKSVSEYASVSAVGCLILLYPSNQSPNWDSILARVTYA